MVVKETNGLDWRVGTPPPTHQHTWAKPQAVGRAVWMGAGASEGHQDVVSSTVAEWAQDCPQQ